MGEDYYECLGVSRTASQEAIASAYREQLKQTHPDVSDASNAQERTRRLIEAKEVLTDEAERARYDRLGHEQYVADSTTTDDDSNETGRTGDGKTDSNASEDFFDQWVDQTDTTGTTPGGFFAGWGGSEGFADGTAGYEEQTNSGHRGWTGRTHGERTGGHGRRTSRVYKEPHSTGTTRNDETDDTEDFYTDWTGEAESDETAGDSGDSFDWDTTGDVGAGPDETTTTGVGSGGSKRTTVGGAETTTAASRHAGAASRESDTSSVDWYQSRRDDSRQRSQSWDAMTKGTHSPWHGSGVAETHVTRNDDATESSGLLSSDRVLFVFGFTFVIYPVLLFGALLPAFPVAVRAVVATGALLVTAFLQSIPQIGIFVFGTWAVLVPVLLGTVGVSLLAVEGILLLTAVFFPFLFSLLTWLTVRPRSM